MHAGQRTRVCICTYGGGEGSKGHTVQRTGEVAPSTPNQTHPPLPCTAPSSGCLPVTTPAAPNAPAAARRKDGGRTEGPRPGLAPLLQRLQHTAPWHLSCVCMCAVHSAFCWSGACTVISRAEQGFVRHRRMACSHFLTMHESSSTGILGLAQSRNPHPLQPLQLFNKLHGADSPGCLMCSRMAGSGSSSLHPCCKRSCGRVIVVLPSLSRPKLHGARAQGGEGRP